MRKRTSFLVIYFLGILTGFAFFYLKTLCTFDKKLVYREPLSQIAVKTEENLAFKSLSVQENDNRLITFEINKTKKQIERVALFDEQNCIVGMFYVTDGKCSGVELLRQKMVPFFQMEYDTEMKRWHQGTYSKKTEADKFVAEFYQDTNIDGQFDILNMFDTYGNLKGTAVFFNHTWNAATSLSEDDLTAEIRTDAETKEALKLSFDFDAGWVPASMKQSSVP